MEVVKRIRDVRKDIIEYLSMYYGGLPLDGSIKFNGSFKLYCLLSDVGFFNADFKNVVEATNYLLVNDVGLRKMRMLMLENEISIDDFNIMEVAKLVRGYDREKMFGYFIDYIDEQFEKVGKSYLLN